MNTIRPATTREDIDVLVSLAREIWTEHYAPIIGPEQVEYMLERFQSVAAIAQQLQNSLPRGS